MNLATAYVQLTAKDGPLKSALSSLSAWVSAQGERIRQALGGIDAKIGPQASESADELADSLENVGETAQDAIPGLDGMLAKIAAFISLRQLLNTFSFGVKAAAEAETASVAFNVVIKDVERTKRLLEELNQFSVVTPFTPQEVREAGLALVAAKRPLEGITEDLRMLGDIASGSPRANLNEMVAIFNKINSQGKLTTETLEQFLSQGINLLPELAQQFGRSERSVRKMVEAGQITRPVMIKLFQSMTSEGGTFYQSMQRQSETFAGLTSTLTGVMVDMGKSIGNILLPALKAITQIGIAVGNAFLWLDKVTMGASTTFMTIVGTLVVVNAALYLTKTTLIGVAVAAWTAATGIWAALAPFIEIIAIGALVGAVLYGLYRLFKPIIDGLFSIGEALIGGVLAPFIAVFRAISDFVGAIAGIIRDVLGGLIGAVGGLLSAIAAPIRAVAGTIMAVLLSPFYVFVAVLKVVTGAIKLVWSVIGSLFRGLIGIAQGIGSAFAGVFQPLLDAIGPLMEALGSIVQSFTEILGLVGQVAGAIGRSVLGSLLSVLLVPLKIILGLLKLVIGAVATAINVMSSVVGYLAKQLQTAIGWLQKLWRGFEAGFRSIFGDMIGNFVFGAAEEKMKVAEDSAKAVADALKMIKPGFFDMDKLGREVQTKILEEGMMGGMTDSQQLARIGDLAEAQKAAQERVASLTQQILDVQKDRDKPEVAAA